LLASSPQVLLLDEPTNHLDIDSLEWLESFLAAYRGAFIVVSHDRRFLDRTARRVLELNIRDHRLRAYTGGYSEYEAAKALEVQKQWGSWKDQQAEVRRMEQDIRQTREHALSTERATNNDHLRRLAKKVAQRAKAKEKRLQRYLEGGQHVERPQTPGQIQLSLNADDRSGQVVASLSGVGLRYSETWLYRGVELDLRYGERVALVGPNGSGKTSLLRMLVGEVTPGEGSIAIGPSVRVGYMPQEQELLNPRQSALDVIRELAPMSDSAVYNFLHYFLIYDDKVRQPVGQFSYGERTRLLLARLVVSGANCLLLDEPVNHLDIPSRQQFETALQGFPGSVIISIHDRAFIENFAATIWRIRDAHLVKEVLRA
jgi:ATP-binding cassette subfamily F protein 3